MQTVENQGHLLFYKSMVVMIAGNALAWPLHSPLPRTTTTENEQPERQSCPKIPINSGMGVNHELDYIPTVR
jgi:hypothetical protein